MLSPTENETESQAMTANDLRVLVSQLNEAVKKAAEKGLRIEIQASSVIDVKGTATLYPLVSVRVLAEVQ